MAVRQETETDLRIESDPATGGQYNGTRIRLSQDMTRLKEKDYRLLKKENTIVLNLAKRLTFIAWIITKLFVVMIKIIIK